MDSILIPCILERIHVQDKYGDMERGIFIIRGENVVLLGEIVSSEQFLFKGLSGSARKFTFWEIFQISASGTWDL